MKRGTYEDLKQEYEEWISDDNHWLAVNASDYIDYNCEDGGYLSENDDEYLDGFAVYVDCNYIEVSEIYDVPEMGWGVIEGEPYSFAMPLDGEIEFEFMEL